MLSVDLHLSTAALSSSPPPSVCPVFDFQTLSLLSSIMYVVSLGLNPGTCQRIVEAVLSPFSGHVKEQQSYKYTSAPRTHPHRHAFPRLLHVTGSVVFRLFFRMLSCLCLSSRRAKGGLLRLEMQSHNSLQRLLLYSGPSGFSLSIRKCGTQLKKKGIYMKASAKNSAARPEIFSSQGQT